MAAVQSSMVPPSAGEYGGDEVSALVLDPGYSIVRAGFAGEDVPKSVVPSYYGLLEDSSSGSSPRRLFGDNSIHIPRTGMSIKNPMAKDGTVEDWDAAKNLWEYAITSRLTNKKPGDPATNGLNDPDGDKMDVEMDGLGDIEKPLEEHPVLMSEPGWNSGKARETAVEVAMEDWGCPAFWLARDGVLAAFAAGKSTALVIDIGASNLSVTPIHDGLILRKGIMRSHLAGDFVSEQIRMLFSSSQPPVPLMPHYMISCKTPVDAGTPANATYRTFQIPPHETFRRLEEERVLTEFKESVVQIWTAPGGIQQAHGDDLKTLPGRPFEMPDGWNQVFGSERFRVAEGIFNAKMALTDADHPAPSPDQTLPAMVQASLNGVDVDIRPHLLNNVVVTGGSSLLSGFTERLHNELVQVHPGPRVRISAAGVTSERRFASWVGGSILGSLGSFHQMWISKREYEEHGPSIVEKRCK